MRSPREIALCLVSLTLFYWPSAGHAQFTYYTVQFDCWKTGTDCKTVAGRGTYFDDRYLDLDTGNLQGWTSVGYTDSTGKPIGSRILNSSGATVVGFRIKIDPAIGPNARFKVDATSGGNLFKHGEIWRRKDDTEAVFKGTNIPDNTPFWNLVYPQVPTYPGSYFKGTALTYDYKIPDPDNWERVYPVKPRNLKGLRANLIAACPHHRRDFQAFAEASDGKTAVFLSDDELFLYNDDKKEIRRSLKPRELPFGINRITTEKQGANDVFVLWIGLEEAGRLPVSSIQLGGLIGRVPRKDPPEKKKKR